MTPGPSMAMVTGGGSGIGRATASDAATRGAVVAVVDLDEPGAQRDGRLIGKTGGRAAASRPT